VRELVACRFPLVMTHPPPCLAVVEVHFSVRYVCSPAATMAGSLREHRLYRWIARRRSMANALLVGHAMGLYLADLAVLVRAYRRAQREVTLLLVRSASVHASSFNLNAFSSEESLALFRFLPHHIGQLAALLELDVRFGYPSYHVDAVECLCIMLRRLASPTRWMDLEELFGRSRSALYAVFLASVDRFVSKWGRLLSEWRGDFMRERAPRFAARIEASLDRCVGFIDGTALFVSRPGGGLQRACYSGHKRKHALKFQNLLTPDGLFFHFFGPVEGRRHDMTLYHESGMDATLADALIVGGEQYYLYGDVAYMMRPWLQTAFEGILSPDQDAHNNAMKVPRTAVEWGFKDVKQVCSSLDFPRKLKIREGPVGLLYKTGALVWNLRCCV